MSWAAGEKRGVAPERLVISCGALDEKGALLFEFLHTVTFAGQRGKTTLTIRSRVTKTTAAANHYIGGYEMGMTSSLERLAELVANPAAKDFVLTRVFDATCCIGDDGGVELSHPLSEVTPVEVVLAYLRV